MEDSRESLPKRQQGGLANLPNLLSLLPDGNLGLAVKVIAALAGVIWLTNGPGADEQSDFKAKAEKRRAYNRHFALKGRGRKEFFRQAVKLDRAEIAPSKHNVIEALKQ